MQLQIFDIQKCCYHDGPGIRTTVFLKGCPLHCAWCHNPESISPEPVEMFCEEQCIRCGRCSQGLSCYTGARKIVGRTCTIHQLEEELLKDEAFLRRGGVTFSGGEPLRQWQSLQVLVRRLKQRRIHVAVDTSCCLPEETVAEAVEAVDLVIADFKLYTRELHQKFTGRDNEIILRNLDMLLRQHPDRVWISVPVIPGVHTGEEIDRMADFLRARSRPQRLRIIPYDPFGEEKHRHLGHSRYFTAKPDPDLTDYADRKLRRELQIEGPAPI